MHGATETAASVYGTVARMKEMSRVYLIGAGALGVHHLEGLLKAHIPLSLTVIDVSPAALDGARAIVSAVASHHEVSFSTTIPKVQHVDVAIIATTSSHRAEAVRELLKNVARVDYLMLEKIMFDKRSDYASIGRLLKKRHVRTWVNCTRRMLPFHQSLKKKTRAPLWFHVSAGSRYGLMTSVIHYIDYLCYLTGSTDFHTDTSLLVPKLLPSKRAGYHELEGTLVFRFQNGSLGIVTTLSHSSPLVCTVAAASLRAVIRESEMKALVSEKKGGWKWKEEDVPMTRQSDLTGSLVEKILKTGRCDLTAYEESAKIHLAVLEPIRGYLEKSLGKTFTTYPFT